MTFAAPLATLLPPTATALSANVPGLLAVAVIVTVLKVLALSNSFHEQVIEVREARMVHTAAAAAAAVATLKGGEH